MIQNLHVKRSTYRPRTNEYKLFINQIYVYIYKKTDKLKFI